MVKHEYHGSTSHEMYIFFMITWVFPTMGFIIGFPMNRMTNSLDDNLRTLKWSLAFMYDQSFPGMMALDMGVFFSPGQAYIEMIIIFVDSPHPTMISTTHHKQGP